MFSSTRFRLSIALAGAFTLTSHADEMAPSSQPGLIESGHQVYQQQCAVCHGEAAQGSPNWRRPDDQGNLPPPPHNAEGHTWRHSDSMLQRMISQGWRDPFNKTQRLTMPAFEQTLTPKEIDNLIVYLKTLWTPEQRNFQMQQSRDSSAAKP